MNLDQLQYLTTIAATGSLTAAAKKLGISQSALSRYLQKVENEAGLPLFYSQQKRLFPTRVGHRYLETTTQIQQILNQLQNAISNQDRKPQQELILGVSHFAGSVLFSKIYMEFSSRFPKTKLTPLEGYARDLKQSLRRGDCHMVIIGGEQEPDLQSYVVSYSQLQLAIPAALDTPELPQSISGRDLSPLENSVFILPQENIALYDYVMNLFKLAGFQPQVALTTDNLLIARQLISTGVGIGFLPDRHIAKDPNLRALPFNPPIFVKNCFYLQKGQVLTPELEYLMYLILVQSTHGVDPVIWSSFNRGLMHKYGDGQRPWEENV